MKLLAAAGLAGACLATSPLFAADLFSSAPPPMDAPATQTELGTNWYIRGDVGYGMETEPTIVPKAGLFPTPTQGGFYDPGNNYQWTPSGDIINNTPIGNPNNAVPVTRGNPQNSARFDYDVALGYRVNDFLRVEGMVDFHYGPGMSASTQVTCPEATGLVYNYNTQTTTTGTAIVQTPAGYAWDNTKCNGLLNTKQYNTTTMANAYIDLGKWSIFSPYVGAGLGGNINNIQGSVAWTQVDTGATYTGVQYTAGGSPYIWVTNSGRLQNGYPLYVPVVSANGSSPNVPIGPQNWNRNINSTKITLAGALMAGVGIQISQSAMLDIGYRFTSLDLTSGLKDYRQSFNLGVRYNIN